MAAWKHPPKRPSNWEAFKPLIEVTLWVIFALAAFTVSHWIYEAFVASYGLSASSCFASGC